MSDTLDVLRRQGQRPGHAWEFEWTTERVDSLKRLRAEGMSNTDIAGELGTTRGSISGKSQRLGLEKRTNKAGSWRRSPRSIKRLAEPDLPAAIAPIDGCVDLEHLEGCMCRFPYGDGPFLFCGEVTSGASYCAAHHRIAYRVE